MGHILPAAGARCRGSMTVHDLGQSLIAPASAQVASIPAPAGLDAVSNSAPLVNPPPSLAANTASRGPAAWDEDLVAGADDGYAVVAADLRHHAGLDRVGDALGVVCVPRAQRHLDQPSGLAVD